VSLRLDGRFPLSRLLSGRHDWLDAGGHRLHRRLLALLSAADQSLLLGLNEVLHFLQKQLTSLN
jgi:hypothetical protein